MLICFVKKLVKNLEPLSFVSYPSLLLNLSFPLITFILLLQPLLISPFVKEVRSPPAWNTGVHQPGTLESITTLLHLDINMGITFCCRHPGCIGREDCKSGAGTDVWITPQQIPLHLELSPQSSRCLWGLHGPVPVIAQFLASLSWSYSFGDVFSVPWM